MIFTTTKKKVETPEKYEDDAVLTQFPVSGEKRANCKFSLNKKAMEGFGFGLNIANLNKIANGFDENNNIILAGIDTEDIYTSNVTAKNEFSNSKLLLRLEKQFDIDVTKENEFLLLFDETDDVKMALLCLITGCTEMDDTIIPAGDETAQAVAQIKSEEVAEPTITEDGVVFPEIESDTDTKEQVFMSQKLIEGINGQGSVTEW